MERVQEVVELCLKKKKVSGSIFECLCEISRFLKLRNEFETSNDAQELLNLGKEINMQQEKLYKRIMNELLKVSERYYNRIQGEKTNLLDKSIYVFCSSCMPYAIDMPLNFSEFILKNNEDHSLPIDYEKLIEYNYRRFMLWEEIYKKNGIDGVARYCALNKKIKKELNEDIIDLYESGEMDKDNILYSTSLYNTSKKLLKSKSSNSKRDVIEL